MFTGVERLREVKAYGPERKLVPFRMTEKAIPASGHGGRGRRRGHLRLALRRRLDLGIGLAYVPAAQAKAGTELVIDVRGRPRTAEVAKKPLYTKETSS